MAQTGAVSITVFNMKRSLSKLNCFGTIAALCNDLICIVNAVLNGGQTCWAWSCAIVLVAKLYQPHTDAEGKHINILLFKFPGAILFIYYLR